MPFFKYLDDYSDITDITFNDRKRYAPLDKFTDLLLRGDSTLSITEREIIAAYVSSLNECDFCSGVHAEVAVNFGVDKTLIENLINDIDQADIPPKFKTLLKYVKKLTLTPGRLVMKDAQDVYDEGWSEKGLSDAVCVCSLFNFYNRLLDGHGIKGNDKIYKLSANHLFKRGYSVPWFIKAIKGFIRKKRVEQLSGGNA